MFITLTMMTVPWVHTNVNTSQIVYFQYVQLDCLSIMPPSSYMKRKGLPSLSPLLAYRSAEAVWALLTMAFPVPG